MKLTPIYFYERIEFIPMWVFIAEGNDVNYSPISSLLEV